jgi:hypothetical protein
MFILYRKNKNNPTAEQRILFQLTTNPNSSHQKRQRYEAKYGSYTDADLTELGGAGFP